MAIGAGEKALPSVGRKRLFALNRMQPLCQNVPLHTSFLTFRQTGCVVFCVGYSVSHLIVNRYIEKKTFIFQFVYFFSND